MDEEIASLLWRSLAVVRPDAAAGVQQCASGVHLRDAEFPSGITATLDRVAVLVAIMLE